MYEITKVMVSMGKSSRMKLSHMSFARTGVWNEGEKWRDNEAHGGLYGVYMNKDGLPGCSLIQGFNVWRSFDYGIYFQVGGMKQVPTGYFILSRCSAADPKSSIMLPQYSDLYSG